MKLTTDFHPVPRSTSIPTYVFMTWCLVKHRDNFKINGVREFGLD
jgi:hypothetical protein